MTTEAQETRDTPEPAREARTGISRRAFLFGGAGAAGAAAVGSAALLRLRQERPPAASTLAAAPVGGPLPVTDPAHELWGQAHRFEVPLQPQQMATPWLGEQTLDRLDVRALFDGRDLGLLLEWDDPDVDDVESIAVFRDAVAVMLPADLDRDEPPPIFMGWEGQRVYVAHWKASWQADLDHGYRDVADVFPGWYSDVYPDHDTLTDLGLDAERASVYAPGRHVGNPLSQRERPSPVEELAAEGFGTLAHLAEQHAEGRGLHDGQRWHVTIGVRGGANAPALSERGSVPIAFAVWHGGAGQVGARKQYADWVELDLAGG